MHFQLHHVDISESPTNAEVSNEEVLVEPSTITPASTTNTSFLATTSTATKASLSSPIIDSTISLTNDTAISSAAISNTSRSIKRKAEAPLEEGTKPMKKERMATRSTTREPDWKFLYEGARVEVQRKQKRKFHAGTVKKKDTSDPNVDDRFLIKYDNGDAEYTNFSEATFNILKS